MDQSGGSGQPRSGSDEATEHPAGPSAPAAGTARPGAEPGDDRPAPENTADRVSPAAPEEAAGRTTPTAPVPDASPAADPRAGEPEGPGLSTQQDGRTVPEPAPGPDGPTASPAPAAHRPDTTAPAPTADIRPPAGDAPPRGNERPAGGAPPRNDERPADGGPDPVLPHRHATVPAGRQDTATARNRATSGSGSPRPPQRPKEPGGGILMGRPFGVPVYVAPSWFLVAALITWVFGGQLDRVLPELGGARYLVALFFAVAFYASVLVHELAHTVAALRYKLPVRRIQLQFFGGVSEIEKESETPGREFVLAFVGPLLSLVLAGVFYLALQGVEPGTVPGVLLAGLMISNLIVAVFNLLPGLPLDGGRMLRAVVWKITGKPMTGTIAAAWVGRALAVSVLIGLPLLTQSGALGTDPDDFGGVDTVTDALLAAILAAIIWTGAGNSLRMARLREHLPELRARALTRRAVPVETDTPLSEALRRANDAGARALVVVDAQGEPLSLVREAAIVGVPEHRRPWVAVSGLAQELTDGMRVSAELAGEDLLDALRAAPATEYLVVEESGEIYGVLSAADVERAFVKAMARPS
ncbi:site-2 protease family protein [Streptomyces poonensis]|uniref:CBS domain-containing protein n=1 Tax=Streptomyces poonensis TaxID=68255 RepID=A0A918PH33_9ACTN|nr:site-2 protease family protein [Streptomyces poonensis]GGZ07361.1 hypothetical protein GCM10010365_28100 [Streptomyces poonensis]GLJ88563.1 hypothetical protein GCM10017589_11630 [Streptomyces poonensis]